MLSSDDEEVIGKLYLYLNRNFPRLKFKVKVPLKKLFPKPKNQWLQSFWSNNSHADIAVFRHNRLVCILEPGGWYYHLKDKKQMLRDRKKDTICESNKVNVLRIVNNIVNNDLKNSRTRKLFKKYFYGQVG